MDARQAAINRPVGPFVPRPGSAATALTAREVWLIIRRHIWLIIIMTILGFIAGGTAWYLLLRYLPKYTAEGYIEVLPPVETDPMIIGSPLVQKEIQYGYRASIAALISQQSNLQDLLMRDRVQQTKWFKQFAEYDENGNIINLNRCIRKAFEDLKDHFKAYPHRDESFVIISMTCGDGRESALIVNEMMNLFIAKQGQTKRGEIAQRLANYEQQRDQIQQDLQDAERALEDVRRATGLTDLDDTQGRYFQHTITLKLNNLELEQDRLLLQIRQLQAAIGEFRELSQGPIPIQIENQVKNDYVVLLLSQQLALQESLLAGRLSRFGENHRTVQQTKRFIEEIKQRIEARKRLVAELTRQGQLGDAQTQLVVLEERLKELQQMLRDTEAKQKELDAARVQYAQRLRIRDERQQRLDEIKEQIEKLKMMHRSPETPKVRSIGPAPEPLMVSSPRWEFYFPGGTVLGTLLGFALAFMIEMLNDLVRTPRDVSRFLHISLLGVVPDASEDAQLEDVDLYHVLREAPYSIVSESYRRLRTNLRLSSDDSRVLLVTSGMPREGKTAVAVNLATALVAQGRKVLLIDANFRRPHLDQVFAGRITKGQESKRPEFGLSSLLAGQCSYEQARQINVAEGLGLIESGPIPPNPVELLGSYRLEQLIAECRKTYDYIIIDTAPVLLVSDPKILARVVDGSILVFNAETTRRGAALRTIRELEDVDATIIGCVLFAAKAIKGGYFKEQFKTYQRYQELQAAGQK